MARDDSGAAPGEAANATTAAEMVALVGRAQRGHVAAFACLVERHQAALMRFSRRLMGDAGLAEDLAQETLLRAYRAVGQLTEPSRFEAWLLAIAANLARNWWRREARWPLSLERLAETYPDVPWDGLRRDTSRWQTLGSQAPGPDRAYEDAEQTRLLQAAIEALPPPLGRVVALHYLDGLNYAEVAAALAVPVSTVKGRLFKSRRRLRHALTASGVLPEPAEAVEAHGTGLDAPAAGPRRRSRRPDKIEQKGATPVMAAAEEPAGQPAAQPELVEMVVDGIRVDVLRPNRIMALKRKDGERFMPIIIGVPEGDAIAMRLQHVQVPRPLTHDLLLSSFAALGARVKRVVVNDLQGETFYARIDLDVAGREVILDARPSDAVALAVRADAPIFAAQAVFDKASFDPAAPPPDSGFGPYKPTERAQKALLLAAEEARRFNHDTARSEHVLLGILADGQGAAAGVLGEMGVTLGEARKAVAAIAGFGDQPTPAAGRRIRIVAYPQLPSKDVLDRIADEAKQLGHDYVGTEHLLLGLLPEPDGGARRVLEHLGVDLAQLREKVVPAATAG